MGESKLMYFTLANFYLLHELPRAKYKISKVKIKKACVKMTHFIQIFTSGSI